MSAPRESLLALPSHELTFRADGTETRPAIHASDSTDSTESDETHLFGWVDSEILTEPADFTPGETLRARYLEHRVTARGVVYRFARVPGGRFDVFERVGMPANMRKAPELRRVVDRAS